MRPGHAEAAGSGAGACYPDISGEDLCRSQGDPGALGVLLGGVVVSKTPVSEPASFPPAPSFHQPHELGCSHLPGPQALQWPLRSSCCSSLVSVSPVLRCASERIIRGYLPSVTLPTICSTNSPQHTPPFGGPSVAYTAVFKLLGNFKVSCVHPFRVCDVLRIQRGTKIAPVLPSSLGAETLKNHTHTRTHARHTCKVTVGIRGQRGRGGSGSSEDWAEGRIVRPSEGGSKVEHTGLYPKSNGELLQASWGRGDLLTRMSVVAGYRTD